MNFEPLGKLIPDYSRFFTVDEHNERTLELVKKYPETVRITHEGTSRAGDKIPVLEIGSGSRHALLFGCPHPNEPIGAMMLDTLCNLLAREEGLLKELDYTWHIIKIIDVDGTRLNEGWFDKKDSIESYAENFYRPPGYKQVEWTFPVQYKTLNFQSPLPETQLLMDLIETYQPDFMYSLHNSGFGGAYYYISGDSPELYPHLHNIPKKFGVPLSLGEPEIPFFEHLAPAIFKLFSSKELYDHLAKHTDKDPAEILRMGAGSDEYAERICKTYSLVTEVPYFYDSRVEDKTELDITRKESLLANLKRQREYLSLLETILGTAGKFIDTESPFFFPINEVIETGTESLKADENWIQSDEKLNRPATAAEDFDNQNVSAFYRCLYLGMLKRLMKASREKFGSEDKVIRASKEADLAFSNQIKILNENLNYEAIPIKNLVGIQLLTGLYTAKYIQENR